MDLDPTVIGGAGVFGVAFAAAWKLLPLLLEHLKTRKSGQSSLTDMAFKASGMSLESLVTVVNLLEDRISKMRDEYAADIAALKKQYEEQLTLISGRQIERVTELLEEITVLKTQLAKFMTPTQVAATSSAKDEAREVMSEVVTDVGQAIQESVKPKPK